MTSNTPGMLLIFFSNEKRVLAKFLQRLFIPITYDAGNFEKPLQVDHPPHRSEIKLRIIDVAPDQDSSNVDWMTKSSFSISQPPEGLVSNALRTASNNSSGS